MGCWSGARREEEGSGLGLTDSAECVCTIAGLDSKRELMSEFVEGEFDPNDQKMYKLLGLDALDEKKARVNEEEFKLPGVRAYMPLCVCACWGVIVWMCRYGGIHG